MHRSLRCAEKYKSPTKHVLYLVCCRLCCVRLCANTNSWNMNLKHANYHSKTANNFILLEKMINCKSSHCMPSPTSQMEKLLEVAIFTQVDKSCKSRLHFYSDTLNFFCNTLNLISIMEHSKYEWTSSYPSITTATKSIKCSAVNNSSIISDTLSPLLTT